MYATYFCHVSSIEYIASSMQLENSRSSFQVAILYTLSPCKEYSYPLTGVVLSIMLSDMSIIRVI
jgi:hypothetical protein